MPFGWERLYRHGGGQGSYSAAGGGLFAGGGEPSARVNGGSAAQASFDMKGADFGHRGNHCTFETMLAAFGLEGDPALVALAQIVHEIDLRGASAVRAKRFVPFEETSRAVLTAVRAIR